MKFKIGNDIIETQRIENAIKKHGKRFIDRVFTENEINYCESKGVLKFQSYSARFAAKESVFKAISFQLDNKYEIGWKDIEILNDCDGKPYVKVKNLKDNISIEVSLSHVKEYAIASAIAVVE